LRLALAALVGTALATGATATHPANAHAAAARAAHTGAAGDSALAVYDGGAVYPHDFARAWWMLSPPQRPPGDAVASRKKFLSSVVDRKLIAEAALARPLTLTPTEQQQIDQASEQMTENVLFDRLMKAVPDPTPDEIDRYRRQLTSLAEIRI